MISLKKYIEIDDNIQKYHLPISFFGKLKFMLMTNFLKSLPFSERLFVSTKTEYLNLYEEVIFNYVKKHTDLSMIFRKLHFLGRYVGEAFLFFSDSDVLKYRKHLIFGFSTHLVNADSRVLFSRGLGEYLERYFSFSDYRTKLSNIPTISFEELNLRTKNLTNYHSFLDTQKVVNAEMLFGQQDIIHVVPVEDMVYRKSGLVYPIQQVYWGYNSPDSNSPKKFTSTTTSGCSGGFDLESATVGAIYELIERDAFLCFWLTKNTPKKIKLEAGIIFEYDHLCKVFLESGFNLHLLDCTSDIGVPVCVAAVIGADGKGLFVSASCKSNMLEAIQCALLELTSFFYDYDDRTRYQLEENYVPFVSTILGKKERMNYWLFAEHKGKVDFFFSGEEVEINTTNYTDFGESNLDFSNKKGELDWLIERFRSKGNGYDCVYRFNFASEVLSRLGYYVVRVVIPKLYPMYLNENSCLPDSVRLREFNKWMNGVENFEINTLPHPFP